MRSRTILLAALIATLSVPLAAAAVQAQQPEKIKITVPTVSTIFYPLYYGQDKGIFAKEGLEIEIISTNGDGPDVDAVISGSAQFSISTPNRLFTSFDQGKPLKAIGMLARRMAIDCAMNKEVADKLGIRTDMPLDAIRNGDIAAVGAVIAGGEPRFVGRSRNTPATTRRVRVTKNALVREFSGSGH